MTADHGAINERELISPTLAQAQRRAHRRFLKGPIPWSAVTETAKMPGQALAVLLAIHHRVALTREDTVTLPKLLLEELGISRDSKARCLHLLEEALLITVSREKGRAARITLLAKAKHLH